jgi:hypothetical protein
MSQALLRDHVQRKTQRSSARGPPSSRSPNPAHPNALALSRPCRLGQFDYPKGGFFRASLRLPLDAHFKPSGGAERQAWTAGDPEPAVLSEDRHRASPRAVFLGTGGRS